ncbi:MAG: hypothetical protein JWR05_1567 [Mucilaginibacter sp.]|nr:hypothetical protein [Mucilaginibacter sp.]
MKVISSWNYLGNKVFSPVGEVIFSAPGEIKVCISINEYIIILLDRQQVQNGANVYCYKYSELLWSISEGLGIYGESHFTSIYLRDDLYLYAYEKSGIEYKLNYETGEILSSELIK